MGGTKRINSAESKRLESVKEGQSDHPWLHWGPYLSERSWGTVREDYSTDGNAWDYLPHDMARSRAYRCGEDGLAGISDHYQILNFSCAFWNKKDPILKERLFGLVPTEGNHGEDVKEYYFYLDSTPTHSYMKYLYKYPQEEYPYRDLIETNSARQLTDREYELLDTGIFKEDKYFDIYVEYAKASPDDIGIKITVHNRSNEEASLYVLPHLWFRNRWSFGEEENKKKKPTIKQGKKNKSFTEIIADDTELGPILGITHDYSLGSYYFYAEGAPEVLFTNNETNAERVWDGMKSETPYVKDAFHRHLINGEDCLSKDPEGTKMSFHYGDVSIAAKQSKSFYLRLSKKQHSDPFKDIKGLFRSKLNEADEFYATVHPKNASKEENNIQRQAFAGMLWSKQYYMFQVSPWMKKGYFNEEPPEGRKEIRNTKWNHLDCKKKYFNA